MRIAPDTPLPPCHAPLSWGFDNSYQRLPERFYTRIAPTPVPAPRRLLLNQPLAEELGLATPCEQPEFTRMLAGNRLPHDAQPIAMAYAGHQFGQFVPSLGDGRAILLGEVIDRHGLRRDIQLKGSGRTPYSRQGDGRAWLGPVLREYLVSEAMHALGIPTTRALAAVATGAPVFREEGAMPGAILTRVAASHARVGTCEYFAHRGDWDGLRLLTGYLLARHFPQSDDGKPAALALLEGVAARQAALIARWMEAGFIHGVMNTDNMTISGETIDYGPCAFLDEYDPTTVYSAIDPFGRYAFGNQPRIAAWNLARLADALLPLLDPDPKRAMTFAEGIIERFPEQFAAEWLGGMRRKLGLFTAQAGDEGLITELLNAMHANRADYTLTMRGLCGASIEEQADSGIAQRFADETRYRSWAARWRARLRAEDTPAALRADTMRRVNPACIPRNHQVAAALDAAVIQDDLAPFRQLLEVVQNPYDDLPAMARLALPPTPSQRIRNTFCGT
ncbi:MAG: YdiU family protein [Magnetococcales bacterium]|nr:YdiU family protein [Magnetococcales bacterium]